MGAYNLSQKQIKSKNKRFLRLKFENESIRKNENTKSTPLPYFLKVYKVVSLPLRHFSTILNFAKSLAKRKFLW